MKVLHINCNYMDTWLHQNMIDNLEAIGIENKVFVPLYSLDRHVVRPNEYVNAAVCFNKWDRVAYHYKQSKIYKRVKSDYNIAEFLCLHAYTVFTDGNIARRLSQEYGIPYVVAVRNTDLNDFFKYMPHLRRTGIKVLREASAIFFLSETYKGELIDKYVPSKYREGILDKSYIVPNGIDDFWHKNKNDSIDIATKAKELAEKKLRVIYAGGIDKNKNILMTVNVLNHFKEEGWDVSFSVIGKIKDKAEYEKVIGYEFVNYTNPMQKEQLIFKYRENDIFIMPSHTESFGLVYAEALSQGLPVIYTRGQGFDGQFPDGLVGYATSDTDKNELEVNINNIIQNYARIVENTTDTIAKFSWKNICKKYAVIYSRLEEDIV